MGDDEAKAPEWLPDGWIVKVNRRKNGRLDRYYVSPVSGHTFRSRVEVMRYINLEKVDAPPHVTTAGPEEDKPCVTERSDEDKPLTEHSEEDKPCVTGCPEEDKPYVTEFSEEDKTHDVGQTKNSPMWLPSGWTLEIRTYKSGSNAGKQYKCYIDPLTGSSFYTKGAVYHYLETGNRCTSRSKRKKLTDAEPKQKHVCDSKSNQKSIKADSEDNVLSVIETSPDGLPPGWIKEVRCKKNASGGVRKDPYYIDPVSGYVFRSKKDVLRYVETGEISKYASKPKTKGSANDMNSIEEESPPPISAKTLKGNGGQGTSVKRRLFAGKVRRSTRNMTKESNELLVKGSCSPPTNRVLFQCEQGAGPSYDALSGAMFLKDKQMKAINLTNLQENDLPDKPLEAAEEEALDQVIEKLLDSVSKSSPGSLDHKLPDPVTENLQNPSSTETLEVVRKEAMKVADKILFQSSELVHNPTEPAPKQQLEFEGAKVEMTGKQNLVESACYTRMEPSNKKLQEIGGNKKMELAAQKSSKNIHRNPDLGEMKRVDVEPFVLGNATQLVPQDGKLMEPEVKFVSNSLEPDERSEGQPIKESEKEGKASATGSKPRMSKTISERSTPIPRRASKRLAGLEADPTADIEDSDRSLKRAKQSIQLKHSLATISLNGHQDVEAEPTQLKGVLLGEQDEAETPKCKEELLGEQGEAETPKLREGPLEQGGGDGAACRDSECPVASPFGDSWPDPCIEFAFKTLTGEIPVLDTTTIQDYLHEQLSSVQIPASDGTQSSVGGCPHSHDRSDTQTQVNSAGNHHSLLGADVSPQTSGRGRVKRLCRRSIGKKIQ